MVPFAFQYVLWPKSQIEEKDAMKNIARYVVGIRNNQFYQNTEAAFTELKCNWRWESKWDIYPTTTYGAVGFPPHTIVEKSFVHDGSIPHPPRSVQGYQINLTLFAWKIQQRGHIETMIGFGL